MYIPNMALMLGHEWQHMYIYQTSADEVAAAFQLTVVMVVTIA
jgi:hypothetical protein